MFTYCKGPKEELVVGPTTSWYEAPKESAKATKTKSLA